ncbi:MAG: OmpA family protein [Myxococcota bacterium]
MRFERVVAVCLLSWAMGGVAVAAGPNDLGLQYETAVKGQAAPALVLHPSVALKRASFVLAPAGGASQTLTTGAIGAGATRRLPFRHGAGRAAYHGTIQVTWADGSPGEYTFDFEAVRYEAMKLAMTWQDVDLDRRTVVCRPSHEAAALELTLEDAHGNVIGSEKRTFDPPAPGGSELSIGWGEELAPAQILVKVIDQEGVWASTRIQPFTISIPHDEVQFALGSADIAPSEVPKLDKTLDDLRRALKEHGTLLDLKLFIAGFTDTVGDRTSNQSLSLARAAAIARWYRKHGLRIAIFYRGFGEDGLAVGTPDETDEPRNRRALYILSVNPPLGLRVAADGWAML